MLCSDAASSGIYAAALALSQGQPDEAIELFAIVFTQLSDNLLNILTLRRHMAACSKRSGREGAVDFSSMDRDELMQLLELNNIQVREQLADIDRR